MFNIKQSPTSSSAWRSSPALFTFPVDVEGRSSLQGLEQVVHDTLLLVICRLYKVIQ